MKFRVIFLSVLLTVTISSPLQKEREENENLNERLRKIKESLDMGKETPDQQEYARYWSELMANNPELAKKFKEMPPDEVARKFGDRFAHNNGNVRSQVDELQRLNLEKLKQLNGERNQRPPVNRRPFDSLQRDNGQNFKKRPTPEEIKTKMEEHRRIQSQLDQIRREEFKQFENRVEDIRRDKFKQMDERQRLIKEQRLEQLAREHRDHEKMQHPASKKQLEDVWNNQDGLNDEDFNARTFFFLHDKNGDRYLDLFEIEALFMNEIKKFYGDTDNNHNNMMVQEELAEMREHVFGEIDRDRDGLISLDEFLAYSDKEIFDVDDEWKPLEERDEVVFSPEDFENYDNYENNIEQDETLEGGEHNINDYQAIPNDQIPGSQKVHDSQRIQYYDGQTNPETQTNPEVQTNPETQTNPEAQTNPETQTNPDTQQTHPDTKTQIIPDTVPHTNPETQTHPDTQAHQTNRDTQTDPDTEHKSNEANVAKDSSEQPAAQNMDDDQHQQMIDSIRTQGKL